MIESSPIDNNTVIIITSAVTVFFTAIGYFLNREFKQTDIIKESLINIDKRTVLLDDSLGHIVNTIESINEKFDAINEKFDAINEKFDSVNNKLQTIDKDGSTTKHELEMISNMIKPLFEMKESVDKTNHSIGELFKRSDIQKDTIHNISERLHVIEKNMIQYSAIKI